MHPCKALRGDRFGIEAAIVESDHQGTRLDQPINLVLLEDTGGAGMATNFALGLNPGGAGTGPWRGWRAFARQYYIFRRRRPTTSPPPPGPAASVAGFGATRPDRGPGGLGTRLRHSSRPPQQAGPGATRPGPAESRGGLVFRQIASVSLGRRAVRCRLFLWASVGLLAGVLARRGPTGSADPRASRPGQHCWGRLPD